MNTNNNNKNKRIIIFVGIALILVLSLILYRTVHSRDEAAAPIESSSSWSIDYCRDVFAKNAKEYWKRGTYIQYSIPKRLAKSDYFAPSDANSENTVYSDCSGFARAIYMKTFGIKLPKRTWDMADYVKDNRDTPYVVDSLNESEFTKLAVDKNVGKHLLAEIEVGDIILVQFNKKNPHGHELIGYKWIYDDDGNKIDMWLIHCTGNNNEKESQESVYKPGFTEGAIRLVRLTEIMDNSIYSEIQNDGNTIIFNSALVRPLAKLGEWLEPGGSTITYDKAVTLK